MGGFPALLGAEPLLTNWDVYSIGYSTSLAFDIAGMWSADPEIVTLGGLLDTVADVPPLDAYVTLAFMAISMRLSPVIFASPTHLLKPMLSMRMRQVFGFRSCLR